MPITYWPSVEEMGCMMTSSNESADSKPLEPNSDIATCNWDWLSSRVQRVECDAISQWIDDELQKLEDEFSSFVTQNSLQREMRSGRE